MSLKVPLTQTQVDAALRLHEQLPQWRIADTALESLGNAFPRFSAADCLLKSVAVNAIYGTNVLAIVRMAKHVERTMSRSDPATAGPELVDRIAGLPAVGNEKPWKRISFAAKFCHFFISAEKFPIYDDAAREVLDLHLGQKRVAKHDGYSYARFSEDFDRLRTDAGLQCSTREIDRYLWLTGMYLRWLRERTRKTKRVNAELKELFEYPSAEQASELHALLPANIERAFDLGQ